MHIQLAVILWISSVIEIIKGDCSHLPVIDNSNNGATTSLTYASGFVVNFTCKLGFNTVGTSRSFICDGSSWINGNIICKPIYCGYIEPPSNGRIVNSPDYGISTRIVFACNEGYQLNGSSSLLCRVDGQWSGLPPTCPVKFCPAFGSIQYGKAFQDAGEGGMNSYGSIVTIKCLDGYVLSGSPSVSCQSNTEWSEKPQCKPLSCPSYPGLNSSCIDHRSTFLSNDNKLFYMICLPGDDPNVSVTQTGPSSAECVNNVWDDVTMACYCDCKINTNTKLIQVNNLNEKGFLKHGRTLDWHCKSGYKKKIDNPLVCFDNKIATIECIHELFFSTANQMSYTSKDFLKIGTTSPNFSKNYLMTHNKTPYLYSSISSVTRIVPNTTFVMYHEPAIKITNGSDKLVEIIVPTVIGVTVIAVIVVVITIKKKNSNNRSAMAMDKEMINCLSKRLSYYHNL